jgi:hypothetical protein
MEKGDLAVAVQWHDNLRKGVLGATLRASETERSDQRFSE